MSLPVYPQLATLSAILTHVLSLLGAKMASEGEKKPATKALWRHPYNVATVTVSLVNIYGAVQYFLNGCPGSFQRTTWIVLKLLIGVRLTLLHSALRPLRL